MKNQSDYVTAKIGTRSRGRKEQESRKERAGVEEGKTRSRGRKVGDNFLRAGSAIEDRLQISDPRKIQSEKRAAPHILAHRIWQWWESAIMVGCGLWGHNEK